jgi:hypothetical protein
MTSDDENRKGFASPPCFLHELDPAYREDQTAEEAAPQSELAQKREVKKSRGSKKRQETTPPERRKRAAQTGQLPKPLLQDSAVSAVMDEE